MEHPAIANLEDPQKAERYLVIRYWADTNGSARLKEQIKQGYEGWPLYLHERLARDFPGAKLDADAWGYGMVLNPTEEELAKARGLANRIVELKLAEDVADAFNRMKIRSYDVDVPIPEYGGDEVISEERHCLVFNAYRPGSANAFETKTIRIDM